jgi:nitrate/TMAO reductase-like tetraheme cytochrome c subunit
MGPETCQQQTRSLFQNAISTSGLVVAAGGVFSFLLLMVLDMTAAHSNPYVGILTWMVAPGFIVGGLAVFFAGALLARRKIRKETGQTLPFRIDLSLPRSRRAFGVFLIGSVVFLLMSAIGSYQTYHFTESATFCGEACHEVMKPELVTYLQGPHARVSCAECHIGKGAGWFVKSKLSGTYQVYATLLNKYPRPVPTPIKNLRPAQDTCEQCHWPEKFVGNLERVYNYYLADETNTAFTVRMLMHVGGGDATHGPLGGIHYHMNVANKIEYYAADESRQQIPWIRVTDPNGEVSEYRIRGFTNSPPESDIRKMDCMDCHNRPAHRYKTPTAAVNLALSMGRIDPGLSFAKSNALFILTQKYSTRDEAMGKISTYLADYYKGDPRTAKMIEAVKGIYNGNFFPEMNANWSAYPDNIGHKDWPGCFRCHDGNHKTADGKKEVQASNCESCHTIIAQGAGAELLQMTPAGQKFKHPADDVEGGCNDCHNGEM